MFYNIVLLLIHALYTSCNKLPTLRSNMRPDHQESNYPRDTNRYAGSYIPIDIKDWWALLGTQGLFDDPNMDLRLYGTRISRTHTFLTTFANENFSCVGNGIHSYYALVKAIKAALINKTFFKEETLEKKILVVSLIDVLKNQFSLSRKFCKNKAKKIKSLNKQLSLGNKTCASNLGNDRYLMLKLNAANHIVADVHLEMIVSIIDEINNSNDPNRIIDRLGLDHMIHLMSMGATYSPRLAKSVNLAINFNKFIKSIVHRLNNYSFSCHRVETWLKLFKIFELNQPIHLSDADNPKQGIIKLCEKFTAWAINQSDGMLFTATPSRAWDILVPIYKNAPYESYYHLINNIITLHKRLVKYYIPQGGPSEEGSIMSMQLKRCLKCYSRNFRKNGRTFFKNQPNRQRYKCKNCHHSFY